MSSLLLLAACSGAHGSSQLAATGANAAASSDTQPVRVDMSYVLPAATVSAKQSAGQCRFEYVDPTNTQISIIGTPFGGSGTVYGRNTCTTSAAVCKVTFTATPGRIPLHLC